MAKKRAMSTQQFKLWLRHTEDELVEELKDCVEKYTERAYYEAYNRVPVDTGYLQASISWYMSEGRTVGTVFANAFYSRMVEEGTSKQFPQPYMKPALRAIKDDYIAECEKILERVLKG